VSRLARTLETVAEVVKELLPEAEVLVSYNPELDLNYVSSQTISILVVPDTVAEEDHNQNGTKWKDVYTVTLAVTRGIKNIKDCTPEVETMLDVMERLRDDLRTKITRGVAVIRGNHTPSRPVYNRDSLEEDHIFLGYLLLEARVPGIKKGHVENQETG